MDAFIDTVVHELLRALAPVMAAAVVALLVQALRYVGLQLSAEKQARTEKFVNDAILSAEERVARAAKANVKLPASKLQMAVADILEKLPTLSREQAEKLVHQQLPKFHLGASAQ